MLSVAGKFATTELYTESADTRVYSNCGAPLKVTRVTCSGEATFGPTARATTVLSAETLLTIGAVWVGKVKTDGSAFAQVGLHLKA